MLFSHHHITSHPYQHPLITSLLSPLLPSPPQVAACLCGSLPPRLPRPNLQKDPGSTSSRHPHHRPRHTARNRWRNRNRDRGGWDRNRSRWGWRRWGWGTSYSSHQRFCRLLSAVQWQGHQSVTGGVRARPLLSHFQVSNHNHNHNHNHSFRCGWWWLVVCMYICFCMFFHWCMTSIITFTHYLLYFLY